MGYVQFVLGGIIAGWIASKVMKSGGYGVIIDTVLAILGGFLGGWLFSLLSMWPGGGVIGSLIVAFIGAVSLVGITLHLLLGFEVEEAFISAVILVGISGLIKEA